MPATRRSPFHRCTALRFGLGLTAMLVAGQLWAADAKLSLREQRGQLQFRSNLPRGRHLVTGLKREGRDVDALLTVVSGGSTDGSRNSVRAFSIESFGAKPLLLSQGRSREPRELRDGFSVRLEPRSQSGQYVLRFSRIQLSLTEPRQQYVTLQRSANRYHLSVSDGSSIGRVKQATSLRRLMLEFPDDYRQLEEIASHCSLPGLSLVPHSLFSPSVIDAVMHYDPQRHRTTAGPNRLGTLVAELDSDQYARREAASDALLNFGTDAGHYLENLDSTTLSFEQRLRVQYVIRSLATDDMREPRPISASLLASLEATRPSSWLVTLVLSADDTVHRWAIAQLRERGLANSASRATNRGERESLYRELAARLGAR